MSAQARLQAPQLSGSVALLTSQPSSGDGWGGAAQSRKPGAHPGAQLPATQARVTALFDEQARPQKPQLLGSFWRFRSQPSSLPGAAGVLQLPQPFTQVLVQSPPLHTRLEVLTAEQERPQSPQCCGFTARSASQPSSALGARG